MVTELETNEQIGIIGYCLTEGVAEVGFMFLPKYHGYGYGTESLQALIEYSKEQRSIDNFIAIVTEGNLASEHVVTKNGFKLDKVVPNAYEIGGAVYADHIYKRVKIAG